MSPDPFSAGDDPTLPMKVIVWAMLGSFGGAVKYISAVMRSPERISNRQFLLMIAANMFVSSFCGLMGGLLMSTISRDWTFQIITASIFAYLGTQSLDWVIFAVKKKIQPFTTIAVIPVPTDLTDRQPAVTPTDI